MLTIPIYQIVCDECGRIDSFPLSNTTVPGVYTIGSPDEVYAHFGGETLEDGQHRCASCKTKLNPSSRQREPEEIIACLSRIHARPDPVKTLLEIVRHAREYRRAEQDGTPRLWRGKHLNDLGLALDVALEDFHHDSR